MSTFGKYNVCCNPFNVKDHRVTKSLRLASRNLQARFSLSATDYLCTVCRKKLNSTIREKEEKEISSDSDDNGSNSDNKVDVIDDELIEPTVSGTSSLSSHEIASQLSSLSQLSINTQLPTINDALRLLNQSPIPTHKLTKQAYLRNKIRNVDSYLSTVFDLEKDSDDRIQAQEFSNMIDVLKTKFHDEATKKEEQLQILTLLPQDWSVYKVCKTMETTKDMANVAKALREKYGILSMPKSKRGRSLSDDIKSKILQFYLDDQTSVNMPGMKDFVSIRNNDGVREHVQKRLILSNLRELYELFKIEYPECKVGFSMFASLRPKYCVLAGSGGTHTVCVCSIHQNTKLMMLGCNLATLTDNLPRPLKEYKDCLNMIICENASSECYFGKCKNCPGIAVLQNLLSRILEENDIDELTYQYWVSKPRTSLETFSTCSSEFIEEFCTKITELLPHAFIAKSQAMFMKSLKNSLGIDEFLVVCDFAENYSFVIQNAAPGFHWNNNQSTIFPVVIYFRENNTLHHRSLVIISDYNTHDSNAVHVFLKIITDFIKTISEDAKKIYYFSDGAPQQFKNYKNFINLYFHKEDFKINAEWHFFASYHGKGPCDGVGGTIKRAAARASLQLPFDQQISTPEALYEWAKKPNNLPNIEIKFSAIRDHEKAIDVLNIRYSKAKPITGTQKFHCVIPNMDGYLTMKVISGTNESHSCKIFKRQKK